MSGEKALLLILTGTVVGAILDILQDPMFWVGAALVILAKRWQRVANHRVLVRRLGLALACLSVATHVGFGIAHLAQRIRFTGIPN